MTDHREIVEKYRAMQTGKGWHTVLDDGCLYDHLAQYLDKAGLTEELHSLFADQHWLQARLAQSGFEYDSYLSDLAIAWQAADRELHDHESGPISAAALMKGIRCALIRTSVNSLDASYPPQLIARALELQLWQPSRVLSMVRKVPSYLDKLEFLRAILSVPNLPREARDEAVEIGFDILAENRQGYFGLGVEVLLPFLEDLDLERALELARTAKNQHEQFKAFQLIASRSVHRQDRIGRISDAYNEALGEAVVKVIKNIWQWGILGPYMRGELLDKAFDLALSEPGTESSAHLVTTLLPQLDSVRQHQAVQHIYDACMSFEHPSISMLAKIVPLLDGERQVKAVRRALDIALKMEAESWSGSDRLAEVAAILTGEEFEHAVEIIFRPRDPTLLIRAFIALFDRFSETERNRLLDQILAAIGKSEFDGDIPRHLEEIAPYTIANKLPQIIELIGAVRDDYHRIRSVAMILPHVPREIQEQLAAEAYRLALNLDLGQAREFAISFVTPYLPSELLPAGLEQVLALEYKITKNSCLAALVPRLPRDLVQRALEAQNSLNDVSEQAFALATLAPYLSHEQMSRSIELLLSGHFGYHFHTGRTLARWIPLVPDDLFPQVLERLLQRNWDVGAVTGVFEAAVPRLTESMIERVFETFLSRPDEKVAVHVILSLAPYLSTTLLHEALRRAHSFARNWDRLTVLAHLAPYMEEEFRDGVLVEVLEIIEGENEEKNSLNLIEIAAPRLSGQYFQRCFEFAKSLSIYNRFDAVWRLAPFTPEEMIGEVLDFAAELEHDVQRGQLIEAMASRLSGNNLVRAVEMIAALKSEHEKSTFARARTITALMPHLPVELVESGLNLTLTIEHEGWRADALRGLFPKLSADRQADVLKHVCEMESNLYRARLLALLLPLLEAPLRQTAIDCLLETDLTEISIEWWHPKMWQPTNAQPLVTTIKFPPQPVYPNGWDLLASYLPADNLDAAIERANSLKSPCYRAKALVALFPKAVDPAPLISGIHQAISEYLLSLAEATRSKALEFLADGGVFSASVFEPEFLRGIADQILEICQEWQWV